MNSSQMNPWGKSGYKTNLIYLLEQVTICNDDHLNIVSLIILRLRR